MKLLATVALVLAAVAFADDRPLGTIYAPDGGSSNNLTTITDGGSVPFTIVSDRVVSVQCDAPAAVEASSSATCSTTLSRGVRLHTAWQMYDIDMRPGQTCVAVIAESGNVSCNVKEYSKNLPR